MAKFNPNEKSQGSIEEGKMKVTVVDISVEDGEYGKFIQLEIDLGPFTLEGRIYGPDWKKIRLLSNATPKITQEVDMDSNKDMQILKGKEIPIVLYRKKDGYYRFNQVIGHDDWALANLERSVEEGYIEVAEDSMFAVKEVKKTETEEPPF